jgi:NAD(P)-dependent dehydrogenase (short-subunit alcohol dehydrogenase family)
MTEQLRFKDRVVVVTGSARGIGFATATLAAQEGALVVVCDLDPAAVNAAVEKIGGAAIGIVGDVSKPEQVRSNVDEVMKAHGRIDVLVNNAAVTSYHAPETLTADAWRREIDVCLGGSFFWAQAVAVASMIPRREGAIVNVGSGAALAAMPRSAAYVSAKHGVIGLTKSLAVDWGQFNIRVNCVAPGVVRTRFHDKMTPEQKKLNLEQRIPLRQPLAA